jgi:hypothetical protein
MKEPRMTLADIERALEDQDRELQVVYREWVAGSGGTPIEFSFRSLECFHDACAVRPPANNASCADAGIRC